MSKLFFRYSSVIRILTVSMALFTAPRMFGAVYDFTPTDGGLVVNLKPGQRILLSTMVNGQEYFVCHMPSYTGGYFGYTNWDSKKGNFLKLIPQDPGATEPGAVSIWTIDDPVTFLKSGKNYPLDGIAYTMWSSNPGGDSYTLRTSDGNSFRFQGDLTRETNHANICNAIFVVPTNRSTVTTFDPNRKLTELEGRTDQDAQGRFNGEKGYGFLGMPYREVYWLDIPRGNEPMSYTNASLVGFNKTLSTIQYSNKEASARPGQALYAFGNKDKHHKTPRTIFRLYVLDEPVTSTCADSYYFAYDEQDFKQYNKNFAVTPATYTTKKKIYTIDRLQCMERLGDTKYYLTDYMFVPEPDSTYYYVGYRNNYCHTDRGDAFNSQFKNIDSLKIHYLGLKAPRGAYGQMMIDVTQTSKQNLGVEFQPGGYFLRTNTGRNIRLIPNSDYTIWTSEEMWHITAEWAALTIKATMFTGSEFSESDPGADIPGWSKMIRGTDVPVVGGRSIIDCDGWARIHVNSTDSNGHLEFVPANPDRHIHYNNNGCVGDTVADQYPMHGETSVTIREARLVKGFTFHGWTTNANGTGTLYTPGQVVNLPTGTTTLYAKATYTGTIHVALSFVKNDGKRYFLTHPGTAAPRFSRARYIAEWTNAWQGMANAENADNNYINTFMVLTHPDPCAECAADEVVLDPRREMRYGVKDSLLFYENFAPENEEYLGLYYSDPNTVLANNTWAGLFKSTGTTGRNGWPDYTVADVKNAKLSSTHYLGRDGEGNIERRVRDNSSAPWIAYNASANQFDGVANEEDATVFQISRVRVADEHYVVIPDTTDEWTDEIVFAYHHDEQTVREVQSKLIGKQLKAVTMIDDQVIYFHPDNNKILTNASQLRLDPNYRLVEDFEYIRDTRVDLASVEEEDLPHMTGSNFGRTITSGLTSPMDIMYNGEYIDIVDTLRITLRTLGPVKIKEYYGRWRDGAPGLHIRPDGSRYRDIIIRTKTTHYGEDIVHLAITPEYPMYNFYPLAGVSKRLTFTMAKITAHQLLDTDGNVFGEEILSSVDVTSSLHLAGGHCSFSSGGAYFDVDAGNTLNDHVTLVTKAENSSGINEDTLKINSNATVDAVTYPVTGRVPLQQSALSSSELIWSAVAGGQRYYIMAGSGGLIFRRYALINNTLYKKEDSKTQLIKGSYDAANSRTEYITPWLYTYVNQAEQQLLLRTEYGVNMDFVIDGSSNPAVASSGAATLTYEYVHEYVNDNANFEEQVKLKYGADKWLKFAIVSSTPQLSLTANEAEATVFSWSYLQPEYYIHENKAYPSVNQLEFGYNSTTGSAVQTRYKAYRIYSMMLDSIVTYCGRVDEENITNLTSLGNDWKTNYAINLISDSRFSAGASGLSKSTNTTTLTTTVTPSGTSPRDIRHPAGTGPFVNIVDTLDVVISLQGGAPDYRFASKWISFSSLEDAHLKIPLIRKTYHTAPHDSILCTVERDEYNYVFPAEVGGGLTHTFTLHTDHRTGTSVMDIDNHVVDYTSESHDHTSAMDFTNPALTEIRLIDEYGNTPTWCEISAKGSNTITVRCTQNGIRSPRSAYVYIAYTMNLEGRWRYINFRLGVTQLSKFQYANNQVLIHSRGASGDTLADGVQQVHVNKNIIYYYNPSNAAQSTDQRVELPVRERNFYGWWRWYSLNAGEEDTDIPADKWETTPSNTGKWNYPFRIIGDSVWIDEKNHALGKKLATQGRYTVFQNPSQDYNARKDPPAKAPMVYPPQGKAVVTYALDKSVYYDNLPLKMSGQIDTAKLDTMRQIIEPTLSLREIYELHPWTERADTLEHYKYAISAPYAGQRYLEDHVVRAPLNARLLLSTEQRYNYDNVKASKHSESMLGYYMRDDNWSTGGWSDTRKDTMIWCCGWDAPCKWYTYNPSNGTYTECGYTVTEGNDFLSVEAKTSIPAGKEVDTVIYCLRAQSINTTTAGTVENPDPKDPVLGSNMFNICRYVVIYHRTDKYGPKLEDKGAAIITNDEIEQHFEVLERLNFDYNKPGTDYTVYPHPLPWADASYGFAYPRTAMLPDNRPHNKNGLTNLANMGEYNLINRIPSFGTYWHKMEQHGGAANGYMIFCDGMSSAGQVAAISLHKKLCEGQKMYFSAYVGNPGNEPKKTCPNFLFSVQGSLDNSTWEDITSYMTGDLAQSNKWYQIYFPIEQKKDYEHFRVRVYNMAANDDGNDFIIDDMCIFATKPPLIAYQANTTCMKEGETDEITHVVLRVDYKGFHDKGYNDHDVYYTIEHVEDGVETEFVSPIDGFINADTVRAVLPATKDTIYGVVHMPTEDYEPGSELIFLNVGDLVDRFEDSLSKGGEPFRVGYIYERLDGEDRPVMYMVHKAEMLPRNKYRVRMSLAFKELTSSICAMTSDLKISNRMMLELNGEEQAEKIVSGMCANTTYDVSLRVRGSLLQDNAAPADINGSCYNDWLLYGDSTSTSEALYGYKYEDIEKVIKDILRCQPAGPVTHNTNRFAHNLSEVSRNEMGNVMEQGGITLKSKAHPYDILAHLVNGGFLTMYHSNLTITTVKDDSVQYMIFPIVGTGSDAMLDMEVDVCPTPVFIKLKSTKGGDVPMALGGFNPDAEPTVEPPVILLTKADANTKIVIPIDSIKALVALDTVAFLSTNDPDYREGVHKLHLVPDRVYDFSSGSDNSGYYKSGEDLILRPAPDYNYQMRAGYRYTFGITMQTHTGSPTLPESDCRVGTVPFTIAVLPSAVQWDPKTEGNDSWNNPNNWIGLDLEQRPIHSDAHFAPTRVTNVIIPAMEDGLPYPVIPSSIRSVDSIKQTGFEYNRCNAVRFLPGGAMGQQQNLNYSKAIVDMSLPQNKWALRAAPVTGMLSGDVFMSDADLNNVTSPWEVGEFDADGRNASTGNASFWLSLFSRETTHYGVGQKDSTATATAEWSKVTNGLTLSLPPAMGWAVYTRTASGNDAAVRLPKNDDIYYYYTIYGEKVYDAYESGLRTKRGDAAAGKLAFAPTSTSQNYTLSNEVAANQFVFGNPSMGYIDIWGFIADNPTANLKDEFDYIDASGKYTTITKDAADKTANVITTQERYLPPMHAIVVKLNSPATATSLAVTLNASRVVTSPVTPAAPAPARSKGSGVSKGIMTVTAINPVSNRCTSRLLIGQGYRDDVISGEDAVLTTVNIDNFSMTNAPSTPFNIYATEGSYGLSIDLRGEVLNVPVSFYMSDLPYDPVTQLWFTGVNNIDGQLVLYDALTDSERLIIDGIRLDIPTPDASHEKRYYIRRRGFDPSEPSNPVATAIEPAETESDPANKIIHNGHVYILRNGHVYTMFGQKLR